MRAGLMRRPPGDPLKASVQRGHHHEDVNPSSGQVKLRPRLGQSTLPRLEDDVTVLVTRSLCGFWRSSSSLEWSSASSPTSLTFDSLLGVVFCS